MIESDWFVRNAIRKDQARPYLMQGKSCRTNDVNARPVLVQRTKTAGAHLVAQIPHHRRC